ncbi:ATP-binding cassette domain-containing protein [Gelidibacter gilvus]|uniref:ATP-binding cassette domain-containing protein n=1 Tax=Gelidibacter gilvus TaxID=59602 RepID=UPI001CB8CF0B|nr:ATP-binding cassette domain-containing protein [Gelidibacter gilvus]
MTIELDSVELNFNKRRILYGIYLKAETNQVVGLLGRNGSGKSCLLQILFGSLKPKYKLIKLNGKPVTAPIIPIKKSILSPSA